MAVTIINAGPVVGSRFAQQQFQGNAVQTIATLKAVIATDRFDKQERFVEDPTDTYYFDAQSAAAESLPDIVAPDAGTGRWIRVAPSGGVPASHAASHADGGSDEVIVEGLPTAETDTTLALMPDGSGGLAFGAVGGLLAAGTDNISAAITALPAGGGLVGLAEGTFTVDGADVTFDKSNVVIEGQGPATIIDLTGTTATKAFDIGAFSNITIRDLTIKLNDAGGSLRGIVFASGQTGHKVENVIFENVLGANTAFIDINSGSSSIESSSGTVTAGSVGQALTSASGPSDLSVEECDFDGMDAGLLIAYTQAQISNCKLTGMVSGDGITITADRCSIYGGLVQWPATATAITGIDITSAAKNIVIDGVVFDGSTNSSTASIGVNVIAGSNDVIVADCHFLTTPGTGVKNAAARGSVTGCNMFATVGIDGIEMNGPRSTITGNQIEGFLTAIEVVTAGEVTITGGSIIMRANGKGIKMIAEEATISGVQIKGLSGGSSIGISCESGGTNTNIAGCIVKDVTAGTAIDVSSTHTGANISGSTLLNCNKGVVIGTTADRASISGNHIRTMASNGVELNGPVDCSVIANHFSGITGTEIIEVAASGADTNLITGNHLNGGVITTIGAGTLVDINLPGASGLRPIWVTLPEPDKLQIVKDNWPVFSVEADQYPDGITVTRVYLKTDASSALAINVEEWTSPTDGAPATIVNVATSGTTETDSGVISVAVAAGSIIMADLDDTDVNWAQLGISFQPF